MPLKIKIIVEIFKKKCCFKSLKVVYTNADCFTTSKQTELQCYIQEKDPDIIAITEIFPKKFNW